MRKARDDATPLVPAREPHVARDSQLALIPGHITENPKAKIGILAMGSRGDFQPYIGLILALRAAGYHVRAYAFKNFIPLAQQYDIELLPINGEMDPQSDPAMLDAMTKADLGRFMKASFASIERVGYDFLFDPVVDDIEAFKPDLMLSAAVMFTLAYDVAEAFGIPAMMVWLQPNTPSSQFPNWILDSMVSGECCGCANRASHELAIQMSAQHMKNGSEPYHAWRSSKLGLDGRWGLPLLRNAFSRPPWPICYCVSPTLFERPTDWESEELHVVGALTVPVDATLAAKPPPPELVAFLDAGPPPVYIGWGSMVCGSAARMAELAVRALYETGERGVVLSGWARLGPELLDASRPDASAVLAYAKSRIYFGDDLPHEWLFPRCKMTVHHGGSGTTHAALRSGRPTVVTPVWLDQFTYRRLVVKAGVGVGAKQLHKLRVAELAAAIRGITPEMEARAEAMGRRARDEDGAAAVVRTVEAFLREKVATGEWRDEFQERVVSAYES